MEARTRERAERILARAVSAACGRRPGQSPRTRDAPIGVLNFAVIGQIIQIFGMCAGRCRLGHACSDNSQVLSFCQNRRGAAWPRAIYVPTPATRPVDGTGAIMPRWDEEDKPSRICRKISRGELKPPTRRGCAKRCRTARGYLGAPIAP